jgi:hypothetical protein
MHDGGLGIPEPGTLVADAAVAFAAELTGRSGSAPVTGAALAHATGRPRPLPVRAVLTALLCLALDDRPLFLTGATRLLSGQLSGASAALLGVTGTIPTQRAFLAAYRRVRYCFHQILSVADPSALPKNRRLTKDDLKARTQPMTPGQAEAARGRPRGAHQRAAGSQPHHPHRPRAGCLPGLHRPGRDPGAAVFPRPVPAHRPVGQ